MTFELTTPITDEALQRLKVGDMIAISGYIFCGRDAVLPKILNLASQNALACAGIDLQGSVIFHTAVSPAGVGPTSSNKLEIESSISSLSELGVKLHLGKGALKRETIDALERFHSVYAVIPPVTALLGAKTSDVRVVAFPELGMEAFYSLKVDRYPAIIAAAHGSSIYHS